MRFPPSFCSKSKIINLGFHFWTFYAQFWYNDIYIFRLKPFSFISNVIEIRNRDFRIFNYNSRVKFKNWFIRISRRSIIKFTNESIKIIYRISFVSHHIYNSILQSKRIKIQLIFFIKNHRLYN